MTIDRRDRQNTTTDPTTLCHSRARGNPAALRSIAVPASPSPLLDSRVRGNDERCVLVALHLPLFPPAVLSFRRSARSARSFLFPSSRRTPGSTPRGRSPVHQQEMDSGFRRNDGVGCGSYSLSFPRKRESRRASVNRVSGFATTGPSIPACAGMTVRGRKRHITPIRLYTLSPWAHLLHRPEPSPVPRSHP
jgi:hypothetical protein